MQNVVPETIKELVEKFDLHKESYKSPSYNETRLRIEFLDPLFELLGWDINNKQRLAEAYKDVIHEDAIRIGGFLKAPDYCLRAGGIRKFFVEAKRPSVNLKEDKEAAFQLRRYGWTAKLPVSILTDFEEFVVYDTRVKPNKNDNASTARISYFTYTDLGEHWSEIFSIFSKDAVLSGFFDEYVETAKEKRGVELVDQAFLHEIETWRELLAKDLAKNNQKLSARQINYSVQKIIDRIIFLRICEDRGIEQYGRLLSLKNGTKIYQRLQELFERADDKYNSGLFHFKDEKGSTEPVDRLTPNLNIGEEVLKEIITNLYYPDSSYEFSVLPAEVLGQVYEQFLGKVIRLTESHRAVVEDKPEVKKAGGVYYTPTYIVEYIVQQTVGKLLEGKTPRQVAKLRILDPACGSGSFLLGAYDYLLNWHLEWYIKDNPKKYITGKKPILYQALKGEWRLTTSEKRRILLNNIYGVDIDSQAVEVTKLSLSLKVLEGENEEALSKQLQIFQERALPDMGKNIKCGNSLIGPDFYHGERLGLLDEEERYRINAFDWTSEFPEIMQSGGFDGVIGNPPWISLTGRFGNDICSKTELAYLINKYNGNTYMPNMYEYFVTLGLNLVRKSGLFSFIIPDRLGYNEQFVNLRERILKNYSLSSLIYNFPFPKITADTLVFVLKNSIPNINTKVQVQEYNKEVMTYLQKEFIENELYKFEYYEDSDVKAFIQKLQKSTEPLRNICEITSGFGGKSEMLTESKVNSSQIPVYKGENINRYYQSGCYWFEFKKENITGRTTNSQKLGASKKILLRKTGNTIIATYDETAIFPEQSLYFLFNISKLDYKFLLAVLNSRLMTFYYRAKSLTNKRSIAQVKTDDLGILPICLIITSNHHTRLLHDRIVSLVNLMLKLQKHFFATSTDQEKTVVRRQIDTTDKQIDQIVYELYDLTPGEIKIVEGRN